MKVHLLNRHNMRVLFFIVLVFLLISLPLSFQNPPFLVQTLCDIGDVFTIPANLEKSFDQISNAVAHIASKGTMPIIMGGDHSIGFPTVRGLASVTSKNIGIIHVDRHADIQEKDLDERMHTTPYFHATNLPNVNPKNLVQIGIGGWQVRGSNIVLHGISYLFSPLIFSPLIVPPPHF